MVDSIQMKYLRQLFFLAMTLLLPLSAQARLVYAYAVDDSNIRGESAQDPAVLMSVFKFHLALVVLDEMQKKGGSLDAELHVPAATWELDTWSPLRAIYRGKDADITLRVLLDAAVAGSDNLATDVLINYLGGMPKLQASLEAMDVKDTILKYDEKSMRSTAFCLENTASPASVLKLLRRFHKKEIIQGKYYDFLNETLLSTSTGANKIKGLLPQATPVGHKTGGSARVDGIKLADNDAGYILLPDGRTLYLVAFVQQSKASDDDCAAQIAQLASLLYKKYTQN